MTDTDAELKALLNHDRKRRKFMAFLEQEHSEENLLLYQEVYLYRKDFKTDSQEGNLLR
eukprot:Pgem_evm1s15231